MFNMLLRKIFVTSVAVVAGLQGSTLEARTFQCTQYSAPAKEGSYEGLIVPATRVAFDAIDTNPAALWYVNNHASVLYDNVGNVLATIWTFYARDWGPGESVNYVRWWLLPTGSYTLFSQTQSQYNTGYPYPDYEYRNCFFMVPFSQIISI